MLYDFTCEIEEEIKLVYSEEADLWLPGTEGGDDLKGT